MKGRVLKLDKPYPFSDSLRGRLMTSVFFSLFVFFFLRLFQPFEINHLGKSATAVVAGYALVCFFTMVFLNVIMVRVFPRFFHEPKWTTGREIFWTLTNVLLIGLFNFLYSFYIGLTDFRALNILLFLGFTVAVAAFPLTFAVLVNQVRLNRKYSLESQTISASLNEVSRQSEQYNSVTINIPNEKNESVLELAIENLLFIKSEDNYIEVHYLFQGKRSKKLIRNTLKNIEQICAKSPVCYRCHKSYFVNLSFVRHVSGNSQGYKLHLDEINEVIPVSRSNNDFIKNYFTNRP